MTPFLPIRAGLIPALAAAALLVAGCATSVERIETGEVKDLSGAWNDTDSRLVSEEMIQDVLAREWLTDYTRQHKRQPAVIVGEVRNLSHEHINVNTFVADMERALINSGKVKFVASSTERGEVREERKEQELHAREDTRKPMGQELGADYMLKGTINTIIDVAGKTQVRYYQVDLTLISLADNGKAWVGQKKIKKLVKRSNLRF
ncbi:MAG: penicillin-binding protein activator LpoB [Candidatus Muproteobacteria bacterium RIFCSPHIGHO2_01_FULL_65_16]|uniref:Penicillin-binding protein activator LpoB n=2 Tax=Candidatus Muproteobacteria TaxID=1817795 RepID=A0A1F6TGG5_9PROT|nr:MAG: penicillin-binding protein activator LpoB [Candidatus Muproteobacteria bacterium RBG_16_65_31]OGI46922.1 MAG: penicillin-binding protein activator LpoB [Candidatus Muproteobacteria bacterium RIFCSPHIGHO2_01_FULL_65_16]